MSKAYNEMSYVDVAAIYNDINGNDNYYESNVSDDRDVKVVHSPNQHVTREEFNRRVCGHSHSITTNHGLRIGQEGIYHSSLRFAFLGP